MTGKELWNAFLKENPHFEGLQHEEWAFGGDADELARLVVKGEKTATASAYPLYEFEREPLPREGDHSVILNTKGEAVCIIQTKKVYITPFDRVTAEHARKEGEGDKSLEYWRKVHEVFFTECMGEAGLAFTHDMKVICEEFEVVFAEGLSPHNIGR